MRYLKWNQSILWLLYDKCCGQYAIKKIKMHICDSLRYAPFKFNHSILEKIYEVVFVVS